MEIVSYYLFVSFEFKKILSVEQIKLVLLFEYSISEHNFYIPLNIGAILNTPNPPMVNICPNANSMKNIGMPAKINVKKYGTKNAPPPFL